MAKSSGTDYQNSSGDTMGIYTGHNPSSQDDIDKEPFVSQAQYEAIADELDEVVAMVESMALKVAHLCKAVDEVMVQVSGKESVAMTFTHYPPGGPKHEN